MRFQGHETVSIGNRVRVNDALYIINTKEFPNENVGDILEIHQPDEDNTRLLLQIKSISLDFQQKDKISI